LNDFLKRQELGDELRTQIGVIMCDEEYKSVQEILDDIGFARKFVEGQPDVGQWIYTRKEIQQMRDV
jgi:hypothetical protein